MKNILGTQENLRLYRSNGVIAYKFIKSRFYFFETTHNSSGLILTYRDSNGYSWEKTYDNNGSELTFKDSDGKERGFDIPEFTMEQLVEKVGNFKLIKQK